MFQIRAKKKKLNHHSNTLVYIYTTTNKKKQQHIFISRKVHSYLQPVIYKLDFV